eukprot:scaffold28880_cov71-Phaeocystis_antarctica.AAC.4
MASPAPGCAGSWDPGGMTGPMGGLQSHLVGLTSLHVARDISGGKTFNLARGSPPPHSVCRPEG